MIQYRPEVDGLRALALVPVILFHAGMKTFSGGFVGVDVFFVISGYLITSIILAEKATSSFSLIAFYERRARRILPALFVVIAVCLPVAWLFLPPADMRHFSQSLVAVSMFSSNILFWRQSGYFDAAAELKPLLHTWSLAVEEQYYMLFPLFLMLMWRLGQKWILPTLWLIALSSLALAQWSAHNAPTSGFFLLPTRLWELAIGSLIAFYNHNHNLPRARPFMQQMLSSLGISCIIAAIFLFDSSTPFPSVYALLPTVGAALVILYATPTTVVGGILACRAFVGIGLISYSAYLWHQPLFAFARHITSTMSNPLLMLSLIIPVFGLAYLSWRFVEQPFRDKRRFTRQGIFRFTVVGSLIFIIIGVAGHVSEGFLTWRFTPEQAHVLKTAISSPKRSACHNNGLSNINPADACEYHSGTLSIATFGDSHIVELSYGLAELLKADNVRLKHFSFTGCPPIFSHKENDRNARGCSDWTQEATSYIANNPDIHTVIVSYRIHSALFGNHDVTYPKFPDSVELSIRESRWQSYIDILRFFVEHNKRVILVLQAPELPMPIQNIIFKSKEPLGTIVGMQREWWDERRAFVMERLEQLPSEVIVIDPTNIFCTKAECNAARYGTAFYFDDDHISVAGAKAIAEKILPHIK